MNASRRISSVEGCDPSAISALEAGGGLRPADLTHALILQPRLS